MKVVHEDLIRARAYAIWEARGRPIGLDKEHWEEAERELLAAAPEVAASAAADPPIQPEAGNDRTADVRLPRGTPETIARSSRRQPRDEAARD